MATGSCRKVPAATMFPTDSAGVLVARGVCADCPVRGHCLDYALAKRIEHGVWGGRPSRERTRLNRSRRAEVGAGGNADTDKKASPTVSRAKRTQPTPSRQPPGVRSRPVHLFLVPGQPIAGFWNSK